MKSPALERIALVCLLAPSLGGCAQLTQLTGGGTSVVVDDAQGISLGSQVRVHGVSVGRVTEVSLEAEGARIGIELPSDVALQSDACATVRAQGMVGEVYLHIDPGHAETGWEGSVLTACDRPSLEDASTESLTELAGLVRDLRSYVAQLESGERALCAITTAACGRSDHGRRACRARGARSVDGEPAAPKS